MAGLEPVIHATAHNILDQGEGPRANRLVVEVDVCGGKVFGYEHSAPSPPKPRNRAYSRRCRSQERRVRSTRPQHSRSVCSGNSVLCARKYGFVGCFGRCEQLLVATRSSFSKGALQNDICRFESYMPSQPVQSLWRMSLNRRKVPDISATWRVPRRSVRLFTQPGPLTTGRILVADCRFRGATDMRRRSTRTAFDANDPSPKWRVHRSSEIMSILARGGHPPFTERITPKPFALPVQSNALLWQEIVD
jgi:hypothetical protein